MRDVRMRLPAEVSNIVARLRLEVGEVDERVVTAIYDAAEASYRSGAESERGICVTEATVDWPRDAPGHHWPYAKGNPRGRCR